jgi:uncharacterized protein YicC (UPF0701 family)
MSVAELLRWPGVIEEAQVGQESLQADVAALTTNRGQPLSTAASAKARRWKRCCCRASTMEAIVKRITPLIPQVMAAVPAESHRAHAGRAGPGLPRQFAGADATGSVRAHPPGSDFVRHPHRRLRRAVAPVAHLTETRHILKKGGQVGKRLDFMMQELNREANTLGAKASVKELADASMELKLLIEQMRN